MFTEKKFDTGQVVINYAEGATSGVPLVLLHGATQRWQAWGTFLSRLESAWHVYALDLRGHGKSGHVPSGYHAIDYIPDITTFFQQVVGEPAILIGESLGGVLTPGIAAQIPEWVRAAIVLEASYFIDHRSIKDLPGVHDYLLGVCDVLTGVRSLDEVLDISESSPTWVWDLAESIPCLDINAVTVILNDQLLDDSDPKRVMQNVTCPALLLYGEQEKGSVLRDIDVEFFNANAPNGVSMQIKDAGHMIYGDQPTEVLAHITKFLDGI